MMRDPIRNVKKESDAKPQFVNKTECEPWRKSEMSDVKIETPAAAVPIA
jgi:hypothetical protein